ncbi:MAG: PEGA domain-containing protein [Betaproteobacteria bacterium]
MPRPPYSRPPYVRPDRYPYPNRYPYLDRYSYFFFGPYGSYWYWGYYPYPRYWYPTYVPGYYDFDYLPGQLRLEVVPRDAAVFVDGFFAGIVDDFDGALQGLALEPGPHHIEIFRQGYEGVAFDVNVQPGQTIKYRATLQPMH